MHARDPLIEGLERKSGLTHQMYAVIKMSNILLRLHRVYIIITTVDQDILVAKLSALVPYCDKN